MAKKLSKRTLWIIGGVVVAIIAIIGFKFYTAKKNALPEGIASGNGRLEAKLVDVAAKEPLRVKEILVDEGALVEPGQIVVQMDTITLEAELAQAKASVAAAQERLAAAQAAVIKQKSEIELAEIEQARAQRLLAEGAGSQRELDVRNTRVQTSRAGLAEAEATLQAATQEVDVAKANAEMVKTRIDDATLKSPVTGRVLYRLAEPGEVLGAGGKVLTLVNLDDVYMEIFLPSEQAATLRIGAEARIVLDYNPKRAAPGYVSFVSPEAQFTPKQVETSTEREKLMFRVKIQLPRELTSQYLESIKTGVRGVGYVKLRESAVWPKRLQNLVAPMAKAP
jgi:HlyD family secretion protein